MSTPEPPRPSGLLEGQTDPAAREVLQDIGEGLRGQYGTLDDPSEASAALPQPAGEAASGQAHDAAARPGTSPAHPVAGEDVPGTPGPPPSLPLGRQEGSEGGVQKWKDAIAANNRAKRNRRGKRPGPQITGVRIPPPGGER